MLISGDNSYSRTANTKRNLSLGLLQGATTLATSFITRTVLIYALGMEYVGLGSLFASLLQVLSLTELGLGSAIVYSLYRPIAEGDTDTICAYLAFFRSAYRAIGAAMLVMGIALVPALPFFVSGEAPADVDLALCWIIYLVNSVASYLFFGYLTCVPTASQRADLLSWAQIAIAVARCVLQVAALTWLSFYAYLAVIPLATIAGNVLSAWCVRKAFPQYVARGKLDAARKSELSRNVRGLLVQKLFSTLRNGTDTLCISAFVGLALAGVYSNYLVVLTSIVGVSGIFVRALIPSAGNSVVAEPVEKNLRDMKRFDFMYTALFGWVTVGLLCLWQPFMRLWVGENGLLGWPEAVGLSIYFFISKNGDMWYAYSEALGLWWEMRWISVAEAVGNVVLNVVLCRLFGVFGVVLASQVTLVFLNFLPCPCVLWRCYFKGRDVRRFFKAHVGWTLMMLPGAAVCIALCALPAYDVAGFAVRVGICGFVYPALWWLLWRRTDLVADARDWVRATGLLGR